MKMNKTMTKEQILFNMDGETLIATLTYQSCNRRIDNSIHTTKENPDSVFDKPIFSWAGLSLHQMNEIKRAIISGNFILLRKVMA